MTRKELFTKLDSPRANELFAELYGPSGIEAARERYKSLIEEMRDENFYGGDLRIFTAPGRTELGGNHTDHNCGKVLAASIQLDNVAVVRQRNDNTVFFRSVGYPDVTVHLTDEQGKPALQARADEQGKTEALIRGIAAELSRRGAVVNGFSANAASTVLPGSGLSSSAAVEVLIGRIFDCLYGSGTRSAAEIARIGQIAENEFFGKPCGLMDQAACASGGAVAIDFSPIDLSPIDFPLVPDTAEYPRLRRINFDPAAVGYALCVIDTAGSHADLTPDYAAIPAEMKAVASFFGKTVLAELDRDTVLSAAADLRKAAGDRALLRAIHFFDENDRVDEMVCSLEAMDAAEHPQTKLNAFSRFLELVNESGDSSWQLLQNIYSPRNSGEQGISTALALTKNFFRRQKLKGACRVHGGGFAGTIQVYIPSDALAPYRNYIEPVFGPRVGPRVGAHALTELRIRRLGAVELEL